MSKEAIDDASLPTSDKKFGYDLAQTDASDVDVAARLAAGGEGETISEADALRIRFVLLSCGSVLRLMAFKEENRLAYSTIDVS